MKRTVVLALLLSACGPAPGYNANGEFVADPNAGLASPRRTYADPNAQPQTAGGQQPQQPEAAPTPQGASQGDPGFYDNLAAASGGAQPPPPQPARACDDSCRFANNGECDDGREGSDTDECAFGTDCADCGG